MFIYKVALIIYVVEVVILSYTSLEMALLTRSFRRLVPLSSHVSYLDAYLDGPCLDLSYEPFCLIFFLTLIFDDPLDDWV